MVHFDDALPLLVAELTKALPLGHSQITVVRDPLGLLTAVIPDGMLLGGRIDELAKELHSKLGKFSPGRAQVLLRSQDLVDPKDVLESLERVSLDSGYALVDRVLTNQDWVKAPRPKTTHAPIGVAFSIKGGVGRTTALAILAWDLARAGKKVLVVDLDLEAPGIAALLLPDLPDYGLVDWCVESLVGQADKSLLQQMIGKAPLADDTNGTILVVPAHGSRTLDYVAKLGRAYMPSLAPDGTETGLADRLRSVISCAEAAPEPPDVVLLDARAGLHDIGSAAVTQLGAEVFLFARDDNQTWDAYKRLLSHLRLSRAVEWGMPEDDLRWKLKMVAAQSTPTQASSQSILGRSYSVWAELYDAEEAGAPAAGALPFSREDESAPHYPLRILFDPKLRDLNLIDKSERPDWSFVESTFGSFLGGARNRLLEDSP